MKEAELLAALCPNLSSISSDLHAAGDLNLIRTTICNQPHQTNPTSGTTLFYLSDTFHQLNNKMHPPPTSDLPLTRLMHQHFVGPAQRVESLLDEYSTNVWLRSGDQRANKLPFMSGGPWKLIYALLIYLYLIKWLLPKLMRPLKPFEMQWTIRGYNLLMVLSNMYAFYQGARLLNFGAKCFGCEIIDENDTSAERMELLHYGWLFMMSRLVEWLDTVFFVLRKKDRQVTKLHVFHHSFVPMLCWIYLKYNPGYTVAFFPFVNTFVHTIMYSYYLLATFGPKMQPYLWWKKYLTWLQIVQFVLILVQLATIPLDDTNDQCHYPRGFFYVAFAGATLFLWLFYTYYVDTYQPSKPREGDTSKSLADYLDNAIGSPSDCNKSAKKVA